MKKLLIIIIVVILPKLLFSQDLPEKIIDSSYVNINKLDRDKAVEKMIDRKALLIKLKKLDLAIIKGDSIILNLESIIYKNEEKEKKYESIIYNYKKNEVDFNKTIDNFKIQNKNEKKIGNKKGFWGTIKGYVLGIITGYFIFK